MKFMAKSLFAVVACLALTTSALSAQDRTRVNGKELTPTMMLAKLFKHEYCLVCQDGKKINCDAPMGGEAGRTWCGARGLAQCGGGHVDYNHCP
jgi:hypothetical protein